ncbi:MAG: tRNA lysidine(34) synthetase TilS [Bacteroidales bacterium]|nr:tRNA lysidine(34) synthetase TilS [Bacteroidales bacterium]
MSAVSEKVASFLSRQKISGSLLLAVSGGIDSSVMAHAVFEFGNSFKRIGVAHVNFHLRGEDSNRDQEFVRNLSQRYGFELFTADFDTLAYAKDHKVSVEIAARELRYNWFRELAQKEGFDFLLTAHNANDNAETLLLNLIRGTGRQGLGAIRPYGPLGEILYVARPLLEVERSEIEEYARENKLEYCIDKTNSQNEYSRNKIRNQVIPLLQEINPSVVKTLTKDIERFRSLNKEVDRFCGEKLLNLEAKSTASSTAIPYCLSGKYIICRISLEKLKENGNPEFWLSELFRSHIIPLSEDAIDNIVSALNTADETSLTIPMSSHSATVERGELIIYDSSFNECDFSPVQIDACGSYSFGPYSIGFEETDAEGFDIQDAVRNGLSVLDAAKVSFPLTVSTMRPGDRFSPFGLKGSKSVADFLNSRKVDLLFKDIIPVIKDKDGKIVCLPSLEIDDHFKVTSQSKKILIVSASLK